MKHKIRFSYFKNFLHASSYGKAPKTMRKAVVSFGATLLFMFYHGYLGIFYSSMWHGSICIFYFFLMAIRGGIILTEKRNVMRSQEEKYLHRRKTFRISAILLLGLDLSLLLPISMMVMLTTPVTMGLIPAIAMATYTTYKMTMAAIHFVRQKRQSDRHILITELHTVNLIDALTSILTLQNTLIMVNQTRPGANDMFLISAGSSALLYFIMIAVTIDMMRKGWTGAYVLRYEKQFLLFKQ